MFTQSLLPVHPDTALTLAQPLLANRVVAISAPDSQSHPLVIQSLATQAARGRRLGVLVGHNRLDVYGLARLIRAHWLVPEPVLARIELARAFTCHQLHRRILTLTTEQARRWSALYVLGLPDTFYDEDVPYPEVTRLLQESLKHLQHLAASGLPILITASAPRQAGRERLLNLIAARVDQYWEWDLRRPRLAEPAQLNLPLG